MTSKIIAVFGSSAPKPGAPLNQEAYELGRLLGEAGYAVVTGGYSGVMEAASRGAAEAGGHVIGVTSDRLYRRGSRLNAWVKEERRFPTLLERAHHLVSSSDGIVALRGGIGTLNEVAMTWSLLQVGEIAPKPLLLLGAEWGALLRQFYGQGEYILEEQMQLWQCVTTPAEALARLREKVAPHE